MTPGRVVEILQNGNGCGSGYLITPQHVLTARHVAEPPRCGTDCEIRPLYQSDRQEASLGLEARSGALPSKVAWTSQDQDFAVIEIDGDPIRWVESGLTTFGKVPKDGQPRDCAGTGFPEAAGLEDKSVTGMLSWVLTTGRFDIDVTTASPRKPEQWCGISGSAIFVDGLLVAVVRTIDKNWAGRVLEATPTEYLLGDSSFLNYFSKRGFSHSDLGVVGPAKSEVILNYAKAIYNRAGGDKALPLDFEAEVSVDGILRFSPLNPRIPFIGREGELTALSEFLFAERSKPFAWWYVAGDGGAGKTRLARQLCLYVYAARTKWRAGFLPKGFEPDQVSLETWHPNSPTLIIADYVLERPAEVRKLATRLARRDDLPPIRLLLLQRQIDQRFDREFLGSDFSDRGVIESARYDRDPITLSTLSGDLLWSLVETCPWRTDGARLKTTRDEFFARLDKIDSERRTLVAMILADALSVSPERAGFDDLEGELSYLLRRERDDFWPLQLEVRGRSVGHAEADAAIALATMVDGIRREDLPEIDKARINKPFDRRILPACGQAIGKPLSTQQPALGRLEPDLIGEFFVLETLHDRDNPLAEETPHEWLPRAAWRMRGRAMADFVTRAEQNFPGHPAIRKVAIIVQGVEESWLFAAYRILSQETDLGQGLAKAQAMLAAGASSDGAAAVALAELTRWLLSLDDVTPAEVITYLTTLAVACAARVDVPMLRESWTAAVTNFMDAYGEAGRTYCWDLLSKLHELAEASGGILWELWAITAVKLIRADYVLSQSSAQIVRTDDNFGCGLRSGDPRIRTLMDQMHDVATEQEKTVIWQIWAQAVYSLMDDVRLRDPLSALRLLGELQEIARKHDDDLLWHLYDKACAVVNVLPAGSVLFEDEYDLPVKTPDGFILTPSGDWRQSIRWKQRKVEESWDVQTMGPQRKLGRNERCPCGSGKKYKHCHGVFAQAARPYRTSAALFGQRRPLDDDEEVQFALRAPIPARS
jgi:hypothetical protein